MSRLKGQRVSSHPIQTSYKILLVRAEFFSISSMKCELFCLVLLLVNGCGKNLDCNLQFFNNFLRQYEQESSKLCNTLENKKWNYQFNITAKNEEELLIAQREYDKYKRSLWIATKIFNWTCLSQEPLIRRQIENLIRDVGVAALDEAKSRELHTITTEMEKNVAVAKIFVAKNVTDYGERLLKLWKGWRQIVGRSNYALYKKSINIWKSVCQLHGFKDCSVYWQSFYEDVNFVSRVKNIWMQVKPLYSQLHAYVRRKLLQHHSNEGIKANGPIPAHLLRSKFGANWRNIYTLTLPYPTKSFEMITDYVAAKKLSRRKIFEIAEDFFVSLGLQTMTTDFWKKSIFQEPNDRHINCQASAWDFCNGRDFRVKQCGEVNYKYFVSAHHEMGHIQYFMNYAHLPNTFRAGANPGFHEAIGDVAVLSTLGNRQLAIEDKKNEDNESHINFLYMMALEKVSSLPFNLLVELWRWDLFSSKINVSEMNSKWWKMRVQYQGVSSPIPVREDDFELGCITQVVNNLDYIRYFVSNIVQFQFFEGLCDVSGHKGLLHNCNIYGSKASGRKLRRALRLGSSQHWATVVNILTNGKTSELDAKPLLKYFQPLYNWLKFTNVYETIGWNSVD